MGEQMSDSETHYFILWFGRQGSDDGTIWRCRQVSSGIETIRSEPADLPTIEELD